MEQCAGRTDRSIRKMAVQGYLAGGPHHPARLEHIAHFVQAAGGNLEGFMQGDVTFLVFRYAIDGYRRRVRTGITSTSGRSVDGAPDPD